MENIKQITQEQLNLLMDSSNQEKVFKDIIKFDDKRKYGVGDTLIDVKDAKPLDVFRLEFHGKYYHYIITNTINKDIVFAFSLYPTF